MTTRGAFTLIELILIVAVLGVLVIAAVPRLQRTAHRMRIEQAAFELTQLLRLARGRAVAEAHEAVWTWDESARRVRVESVDDEAAPAGGGAAAASGPFESAALPEGVSVSVTREEAPVPCRCVEFFPAGTAEATTLTVTFDQLVYTVTVDAATGQALLAAGSPAL